MNVYKMTEEQKSFIEHKEGNLFVTAVPGAGKTECVAQRFIEHSAHADQQGIAVLTFTHAAASEIQQRIAKQGVNYFGAHYVGTIDSFIRKFLIVPFFEAEYKQTPDIRDNWRSFGHLSVVSFPNNPNNFASDITLDDIDFNNDQIKWPARKTFRDSPNDLFESKIVEIARAKRNKLIKQGLLDSDTARKIALNILNNNLYNLPIIVNSRFREIIVDEVQDCNEVDRLLIKKFVEHKVKTILIGDLDQDIYSFRGSNAEAVKQLSEQFPFNEMNMSINFRSGNNICQLVTALRSSNNISDSPGNSDNVSEIIVVTYKDISHVSNLVNSLLSQNKSQSTSLARPVILAAEWNTAASAAGGERNKTQNKIRKSTRFVSAISSIFSSADDRDLLKAVDQMELAIRESMPRKNNKLPTKSELDSLLKKKDLSTREACLRIAHSVQNPTRLTLNEFKIRIESSLMELAIPLKQRPNLVPNRDEWDEAINITPEIVPGNFQFNSIHGSKGLQYDSVVLVLNSANSSNNNRTTKAQKFLDCWYQNKSDESRRLFYVGASRAKSLLILAVDEQIASTLYSCLSQHDVTFSKFSDAEQSESYTRPIHFSPQNPFFNF